MSFLKPKPATSISENTNNGLIRSTFSGQMNQGVGANNFIAQLLGLSPGGMAAGADRFGNAANGVAEAGGAEAGYEGYLSRAGFAPAMRQMGQNITGQGAAAGILNSGSTARRLQTSGAELNNQFFNNYLQQLGGVADRGQQAGGLIANAGQRSSSVGARPSTLGSIASTAGGIASIFSDRRLKENIEKIGEHPDGLGIYNFSYIGEGEILQGVMADEVALLRPYALGPIVNGYATVNYEAL